MNSIIRRRAGLLALPALAFLALGCFEQPITESMEIRFLGDDMVMVRVVVKLTDPKAFKDSVPAQQRIEEARQEILDGRDPWTLRFESLNPAEERITWDKTAGQIARVDHKVICADPDGLRRFFRNTLIQVTQRKMEGEEEVLLVPWTGNRASRSQQERFDREMQAWGDAVGRYLEAGRRFYDYLDRHPQRAPACFAKLFRDLLPEEKKDAYGAPTRDDAATLDPFNDAMNEMLGLFALPSDSAYSVEELSRLVYDPFPAPLTVRVPGPAVEVEGFEMGAQGILRVPPISLWSAFTRLQDQWITPNPAIIYYERTKDGRKTLDLDDFLRRSRGASPPASAADVVRAIADEMRPAPAYRVRWRAVEPKEPKGIEDIWDLPVLQ